jgi:hypothetical protein
MKYVEYGHRDFYGIMLIDSNLGSSVVNVMNPRRVSGVGLTSRDLVRPR